MAPGREHPERPRARPDRLTETSFKRDLPNRTGRARPRCAALVAPLPLPASLPAPSHLRSTRLPHIVYAGVPGGPRQYGIVHLYHHMRSPDSIQTGGPVLGPSPTGTKSPDHRSLTSGWWLARSIKDMRVVGGLREWLVC